MDAVTNQSLIRLTQEWPARIVRLLRGLRMRARGRRSERMEILEDIDHFPSPEPKDRRALFMLSPSAWLAAAEQFPNIRLFNYCGLTYEIVRALNENGYKVDIADFTVKHVPTKRYDLFVGHGGNCGNILESLPSGTPVFQYVSGVHRDTFERESAERYAAFEKRRKVSLGGGFRRSFQEESGGEEILLSRADALFVLNCPRMVASYGVYRDKFVFTGYGAFMDQSLWVPPEDRDFGAGRRNFIYVGGTGGNIQKGLDVLLEAFARSPGLNLYIYCKVEPEIVRHYQYELSRPNIHYIYHWRLPTFSGRLRRLMRKICFTVHAPCNFGLGTAFMGSLGLGLIPCGYVDYAGPADSAVLADSWQVEALVECIAAASERSSEWCANASRQARAFYAENCTPEGFHRQFAELVWRYSRGGPEGVDSGPEASDSPNRS